MRGLEKILIPMDDGGGSEAALRHGALMVQDYDAKVDLLHVIETRSTAGLYPSLSWKEEGHEGEDAVMASRMRKAARAAGIETRRLHTDVRHASHPGPEIVEAAGERDVDLIVMGTHGRRGLRRLVLGSVAEGVLRHASCPVVSVSASSTATAWPPKRILGAVDLSDRALSVAAQVAALANEHDAEAHLVHVIETVAVPAYREIGSGDVELTSEDEALSHMRRAAERAGSRPEFQFHVPKGQPAEQIVHLAESLSADLIVCTTASLSGLARMVLGSVCQKVLASAHCPVWTLHRREEVIGSADAA